MRFQPFQQIHQRYRLIRPLGEGGQGEVWLALSSGAEGFSKEVVLKCIHLQATTSSTGQREQEAFLREAQLAALFHHPNVVYVFDVGKTDDETLFLVMEYVRGCTFADLLEASLDTMGSPLPWDVAAFLISEACRGIHYAHQCHDKDGQPTGLIHRDLKPTNILLSEQGVVKIIDFGLAKAGQTLQTQTGKLKGTPMYMSPEQARGMDLDHRSDIFSLGVVFYELCTGHRLFAREHPFATVHAVIKDDIPRFADIVPDVAIPASIEVLIRSMLEKNPTLRPQSAKDVKEAIKSALADEQIRMDADDLAFLMEDLAIEPASMQPVTGLPLPTSEPLVQLPPDVAESPRPLLRASWMVAFSVACLLGALGLVVWTLTWKRTSPTTTNRHSVASDAGPRMRPRPVVRRVVKRKQPAIPAGHGRLLFDLQPGCRLHDLTDYTERKGNQKEVTFPTTPIKTLSLHLLPGSYQFRCLADGVLFRKSFFPTIKQGIETRLRLRLSYGTVRFVAAPFASVYLKGYTEARRTGEWLKVPVGQATFTLYKQNKLEKRYSRVFRLHVKQYPPQTIQVKW
jgi:serine/threonine protein kinase